MKSFFEVAELFPKIELFYEKGETRIKRTSYCGRKKMHFLNDS